MAKKKTKNKWNKKFLVSVVVASIVLISLGGFAYASGLIPGGWRVCDASVSCLEDKYCDLCSCPEGYNKIPISKSFGGGWYCESNDDLILDPESETFEEDALQFVQDYLESYCGDICTDLECGELCTDGNPIICNEDRYMVASWGQGKSGARLVNVECIVVTDWDDSGVPCQTHEDCTGDYRSCQDGTCKRQSKGTIPWRMWFYVESPTGVPIVHRFFDNYCADPSETMRCTFQEYCDDYAEYKPDINMDWCVGNMPMDVRDYDESPLFSVFTDRCNVCMSKDLPFTDECLC